MLVFNRKKSLQNYDKVGKGIMESSYVELSEEIKASIDDVLREHEGFRDYSFQVKIDYPYEREFYAYPSDKGQAITVNILYKEDKTGTNAKFLVERNTTPLDTYILDGYDGEEILIPHSRKDSKDVISEKAIKSAIWSMVRFTLRMHD